MWVPSRPVAGGSAGGLGASPPLVEIIKKVPQRRCPPNTAPPAHHTFATLRNGARHGRHTIDVRCGRHGRAVLGTSPGCGGRAFSHREANLWPFCLDSHFAGLLQPRPPPQRAGTVGGGTDRARRLGWAAVRGVSIAVQDQAQKGRQVGRNWMQWQKGAEDRSGVEIDACTIAKRGGKKVLACSGFFAYNPSYNPYAC